MWRTNSWCSICLHTQVKLEDAPRLLKIPKSECPDAWVRLPRHRWPKSWADIEDPVVPLERNSHGHFVGAWMGRSTKLGRHVCSSKTRVISVNICGCHQNGWIEVEYGFHVWEIDEKTLILTNKLHFLIMYIWDVLNVNANPMKQLLNDKKDVWITYSCWNNWKITMVVRASRKKRGLVLRHGKDMLENALSETENWQTKKWSSFPKFQVLAWMTFNSSRKNSNQFENCQKFAHKLSWNACTWLELVDQTFLWSVDKLARSVTKWTGASDRRLAWLISYIYHTNDCRQYCHVGNTAQHCRLGLFPDSDFACDLQDSKSTSGWSLASSEVEHLSPSVGCARSELLSRTVLQSLKSFLLMLDYAWMGYLLSVSGTK